MQNKSLKKEHSGFRASHEDQSSLKAIWIRRRRIACVGKREKLTQGANLRKPVGQAFLQTLLLGHAELCQMLLYVEVFRGTNLFEVAWRASQWATAWIVPSRGQVQVG